MSRDVYSLLFLATAAATLAQGQTLRISQALTTLRPGDTLTVPAGNYQSQGPIHVTVAGPPDKPIRIVGQGDPSVAGFVLESTQHVEISGFRMLDPRHPTPPSWRDMPATIVDRPAIVIDPAEQWSRRQSKVMRTPVERVSPMNRPRGFHSVGNLATLPLQAFRCLDLSDLEPRYIEEARATLARV